MNLKRRENMSFCGYIRYCVCVWVGSTNVVYQILRTTMKTSLWPTALTYISARRFLSTLCCLINSLSPYNPDPDPAPAPGR